MFLKNWVFWGFLIFLVMFMWVMVCWAVPYLDVNNIKHVTIYNQNPMNSMMEKSTHYSILNHVLTK
jgi:hypothetical protein